jgi:hypothetical protein
LFLMPSAQKVFFPFLRERFPHLVRRYEERFRKSPYLRGPYTEELRQRVRTIRDRYGLASAPVDYRRRSYGKTSGSRSCFRSVNSRAGA